PDHGASPRPPTRTCRLTPRSGRRRYACPRTVPEHVSSPARELGSFRAERAQGAPTVDLNGVMPAEGAEMRQKAHVEGPLDTRVPVTEVVLSDGEVVRLYDTSGPASDPALGLPELRRAWIVGRGDVETYAGRAASGR